MSPEATNHMPSDAPREPSSGSISAGDVIDGKYLVGECIAWGGMGIVTEATHLDLQKAVALKCVRPEFRENEEMVARFLNEARIAANLRNEHVARVLDFGKTEAGIPYLVMERLEGMSLAALVMQRGPLPVSEAVDYLLQTCEALAEAHAQGIVHRDIKPENLFLTHGVDGAPILKVLDFGISKQTLPHIGRTLTNPSSSMGSPCYMSPEQMRNARLVDTRTDIWAMGAVLFELLVAQTPFDGDSLPEICAHVLCDVPRSLNELRPALPRGLEAVVSRCLEKDRDNRFADVADFARALAKYASPDGRASVPSIEHITSIGEPADSAERRQPAADARLGLGGTPLEQSTTGSERGMQPGDGASGRITHIPGEHSRSAFWLTLVVVFAIGAGAGVAQHLGHDVLRPLRGVLIAASLREDAPDVPPVGRALEPQLPPPREPARAERERDAPGLASPEPTPSSPAQTRTLSSKQRNASTAAVAPYVWPARPSPEDPYGVVPGP
jgi:serine/threonine protein kinase